MMDSRIYAYTDYIYCIYSQIFNNDTDKDSENNESQTN